MTRKDIADDMGKDTTLDKSDLASLSRRRLLKLGAYVPPAIIGMAIIGSVSGAAHAGDDQDGGRPSCKPTACRPCNSGGKKKDSRQSRKDAHDCLIAQKKRNR